MQMSDLARLYMKDSFIGCFRELEGVQLNLFLLDSATLNIKRHKWVVILSMVIRVLNALPVGYPPAIYIVSVWYKLPYRDSLSAAVKKSIKSFEVINWD